MTIDDILEYLTQINIKKDKRTIQRWFQNVEPTDIVSGPPQYNIEHVEWVLLLHKIPDLYLSHHPDPISAPSNNLISNSKTTSDLGDLQQAKIEMSQIKNDLLQINNERRFEHTKERLILNFLLQKVGYEFLDQRLRKDFSNMVIGGKLAQDKGIFAEQTPKFDKYNESTLRIKSSDIKDIKHYFRKIRSDKGKKRK